MTPLEICYEDTDLIAINKPHGLLVHRSPIAADASEFAVQQLRDQIGQHVFPVHRLDRKTSGVLLFAKNGSVNALMQKEFAAYNVHKTYIAIVRGYIPEEGIIDYDLTNDNGQVQKAITRFKCLQRTEINITSGKYPTSRYSLVELRPETGRMHQLRKHMAHILHPIIGDRPHGCNKQNRFFKSQYEMTTMMLHASALEFKHPIAQDDIRIRAAYQSEFSRVMEILGFHQISSI